MAYDVIGNNKKACPMGFYALYIRSSNISTCHIVLKPSAKYVVTTPRCEVKPMAEDTITIVNEI